MGAKLGICKANSLEPLSKPSSVPGLLPAETTREGSLPAPLGLIPELVPQQPPLSFGCQASWTRELHAGKGSGHPAGHPVSHPASLVFGSPATSMMDDDESQRHQDRVNSPGL